MDAETYFHSRPTLGGAGTSSTTGSAAIASLAGKAAGRRPFATMLVALGAAIFVPMFAFAGIAVYLYADQYRQGVRERLIATAKAVSVAIDRELAHRVDVLDKIAQSELLDRPDLTSFHALLRRVRDQRDWLGLAVFEPTTGRQLLNTEAAFDAELPDASDQISLREVQRTERPLIVGILPGGTLVPDPFILIRVPMMRSGKVPLVLSAAIPPREMNDILTQQLVPANSVVAVLDPRMNIAARNRAQEQFVGTRATPSLTDKIDASEHGMFLALNKEGQSVHTVFHKSPVTRWTVAIGIPSEFIDGPLRRQLIITGSIGLVLVLIGFGLAYFVGSTIARRCRVEEELEAVRADLAARERATLIASKEKLERDRIVIGESLKSVEAQLHQAQKMEALGTFAGGIAHDFNNMLFPIRALAELTMADMSPDDLARENLSHIIEAATRAAELVKRIMAISRKHEMKIEAVDISACVREAFGVVRNVLPATITIVDEVAADVGIVRGDATQIHSVILNLAANAAHAIDGNVGRLTIGLSRIMADAALAARHEQLPESHSFARFSITDTGHGMDEATLRRIFEPFFTTKPVGEGTGLGLAMVHGIVKGMGGAIEVESTVGIGTTFTIYLPLER